MALELGITVSQSNDATSLTITDATSTTAATGWGIGENVDYTELVNTSSAGVGDSYLTLDIEVTDKDNVTTVYDTIDLYDFGATGPFTSTSKLTWTFNADDLVTSAGAAMGDEDSRLTDGVWKVTYTVYEIDPDGDPEVVDDYVARVLVDGDVRADVYDALREISKDYDAQCNHHIDEIMEALLKFAYLRAINASGSVSEEENLINMLWTLDKLNSDGSKYDW